jgi:hypothetical protein
MNAMKLYIDLDTRAFYPAPLPVASIKRVQFKRRDTESIDIIFAQKSKAVELPSGFSGTLGIKKFNQFGSGFIAVAPNWQVVSSDGVTAYSFYINFFTAEIEAEFASVTTGGSLQAMLEVQWKNTLLANPIINSSVTLPVSINNDVIKGDEGIPSSVSTDFRATQEEAEQGIDNTKWMTPLRVSQSIASLSGFFKSTFVGPIPPNPVVNGTIWVNSTTLRSHVLIEGAWAEITTA